MVHPPRRLTNSRLLTIAFQANSHNLEISVGALAGTRLSHSRGGSGHIWMTPGGCLAFLFPPTPS